MRTLEVILGRERLSEVDSSALPALLGLCRAVNVRAHWDEQDGILYIEPPAMGKRLALATGAADGPLSLQVVARLKDIVEQAGVSVVVTPSDQDTTQPSTALDLSVEVSDHISYSFDLPSQIAEGVYAGLVRFWADPTGSNCVEESTPEQNGRLDRPDLPEMRLILYPDPDATPDSVLETPDVEAPCSGAADTETEEETELEEPLARLHGTQRTTVTSSFEVPPAKVTTAPQQQTSIEVSKPLFSRPRPRYNLFQPPGGGEYVVFQHPQAPAPPKVQQPEAATTDPAAFFQQFDPDIRSAPATEEQLAPAASAPVSVVPAPVTVVPPASSQAKPQFPRRERPALVIQNSGAVIRLP